LWPFGIFSGRFGKVFPVLVCCAKKNLATLFSHPSKFYFSLETLIGNLGWKDWIRRSLFRRY
jgi:hypothetical protein